MYSMWKIHIALHNIHKIMFFLAMSYDPFKNCSLKGPLGKPKSFFSMAMLQYPPFWNLYFQQCTTKID